MKAFALGLVIAVVLARSGAAHEADLAYAGGDFEAARRLGREAQTAEGSSLACEAGLVLGSYFEAGEGRVRTLHAAIRDCADAIETGTSGAGAYVNYAIGVAFEAKRRRDPALAAEARKLFLDAVGRFPDSGFAHAGLAGWHWNVARQAGLGRIALGASRDEARREFSIAIALDPDNLALRYEYLRFLVAGDRKERRGALEAAAGLAALAPRDAFDGLLLKRAETLAAALAGSGQDVDAALAATEPFPGLRGEAPHIKFNPPFGARFPARPPQGG